MLFQGDRGFDGLPGLPGEKGHRVSMKREHFWVSIRVFGNYQGQRSNNIIKDCYLFPKIRISHISSRKYSSITVLAAFHPVFDAASGLIGSSKATSHLSHVQVLTDMNSKPVELIRTFDAVTRGGTDSRPSWAAFNQA